LPRKLRELGRIASPVFYEGWIEKGVDAAEFGWDPIPHPPFPALEARGRGG